MLRHRTVEAEAAWRCQWGSIHPSMHGCQLGKAGSSRCTIALGTHGDGGDGTSSKHCLLDMTGSVGGALYRYGR